MKPTRGIALIAALGLAACMQAETAGPTDPMTAALAGKALVDGADRFDLGRDGTITGVLGPERTRYAGTWRIADNALCTRYSRPVGSGGENCNAAVIEDGVLTTTSRGGRVRVWAIQ